MGISSVGRGKASRTGVYGKAKLARAGSNRPQGSLLREEVTLYRRTDRGAAHLQVRKRLKRRVALGRGEPGANRFTG